MILATETQDQKSYNEPGEDSHFSFQFPFLQKEDPLGPINTSPGLYFARYHLYTRLLEMLP